MLDRRHFLKYSSAIALGTLMMPRLTQAQPTSPKIKLGIDVLAESGFSLLRGKRVGLLTHPAGVNRYGQPTVQVLNEAPGVNLTALFGPEHGIYGDEKANVKINDRTDPRTGLPVFSLYGTTRRPTAEMLQHLDVLVIDLQDLGVRSYTYVSAMKYAIEACFQQGKEVIVLDRPNPIGGLKVDGPPLDSEWMSYVGTFQVPYVHGMTIGELARYALHTPGVLSVPEATRKAGKCTVIPMKGWNRNMLWSRTGLQWIPTSPAIPDLSAAMGYSMTGLGTQIGGFSHGYGTAYPFRMLTYRGRTPEQVMQALKAKHIQGLDYQIVSARNAREQVIRGVYVKVINWDRLKPTEISFHMMQLAAEWNPQNPFATADRNTAELFNKHVGSTAWWNALSTQGGNINVRSYVNTWHQQARAFQQRVRGLLLYT